MTCKNDCTSGTAQVVQLLHKAQVTHKSKGGTCAVVSCCFYSSFLYYCTTAQVKRGGSVESEKGPKKAQNRQKQVKYKIYRGTAFNLCSRMFAGLRGAVV